MRDIGEVVKQKQARLQELRREIQRIEGQLEVLETALRVMEEDDVASTGPVLTEPKGLRRWPEAATSSPEKPAAADRPAAKQFP